MGVHSDWPYPTGDPNKDDEQIDVEAALAYTKLRRGKPVHEICQELKISRRTFYRRVEALIVSQETPSRRLIAAMEFDNLQELTRMVYERLTDEASNADFAKLVGESRQLSTARQRLFADAPTAGTDADEDEDTVDEWVAEAAEENEIELREVRGVS